MAASIKDMRNPEIVKAVLQEYLDNPEKPLMAEVARTVGVSQKTVMAILKQHLDPERFKFEKALRYSRTKLYGKNAMRGKTGEQHHNYKGLISSGDGYFMRKVGKDYVLEHRIVMAEALGIPSIPEGMVVHHIDGDPANNSLDNLALMTPSGHSRCHSLLRGHKLSPLSLWEHYRRGTSR